MNFSFSDILKSIFRSLWMDLLPMHDFVTSCTGHLENTGSLSEAALPNVDTFH